MAALRNFINNCPTKENDYMALLQTKIQKAELYSNAERIEKGSYLSEV